MRLRDNVLLQFTLGTLLVIALVSTVAGYFIGNWTMRLQLEQHQAMFPEVIRQEFQSRPALIWQLSRHDADSIPALGAVVDELMRFGNIQHIKIWGAGAVVLASSQEGLAGRQFPDNSEFQKAWQNQTVSAVEYPEADAREGDNAEGIALEMYVPVQNSIGQVVAVAEIYESIGSLYGRIQKSVSRLRGIIGISGTVIYALLFAVFYSAQRRQKAMVSELRHTQDAAISAMAGLMETRDNETGEHIHRTRTYVRLLAETLRKKPEYRKQLTPAVIQTMVTAAPLHDIGKVGIPDAVLHKPGRLTAGEFDLMKQHTLLGKNALEAASRELGPNSFLETARAIAYGHHEKWDGSGYPQGLRGNAIPLEARLMALADVYDALTTRRVYKEAYPHAWARDEILRCRGSHFDPDVVDAFLEREEQFRAMAGDIQEPLMRSSRDRAENRQQEMV